MPHSPVAFRARIARFCGLCASALAASACAGHGGIAPTGSGSAATPSTTAATRAVTMTLTIPDAATAAKRRIPAYVSPSAANVTVTANPGGYLTNAPLSNCTSVSGGRACSFVVTAPIGADTFTIVVTDANAAPVSGGSNFTATIVEGTNNVILPLILGGVVDHATVAVGTDPGPATATRTVPVTVTAFDKDSNTIVGSAPYVNAAGAATPLTLTFGLTPSDTSDPAIVVNGSVQGGSANTTSVAAPSTTVGLQLAANQPTIGSPVAVTAGATNVPSSTAYLHVTGSSTLSQTTTGTGAFFGAANGLLASPPFGVAGTSYSIVTASNGEVINLSYIPGVGIGSSSYCSLPTGGGGPTYVGGVAVASDGSFYANYREQTGASSYVNYVSRFRFGAANSPCTQIAGPISFHASVTGHLPGPIVVTPNFVFAIVNVPGPNSTQEWMAAATDLSALYITDISNYSATWQSATATADGKVWVATDSLDSQVLGFAGASPSSVTQFTTFNVTSSGAESIATDGSTLYVACTASGVAVLTPNGLGAPTQTYLGGTTFGKSGAAQSVAIGPDGRLYLLTSSGVNVYDRVLGGSAIATLSDGSAGAIATGADGDLWVSDASAASVGRIAQGIGS